MTFFVSSLADLVLKDKIFVYDLAHQRIGWANYDCKFNYESIFLSSPQHLCHILKISLFQAHCL